MEKKHQFVGSERAAASEFISGRILGQSKTAEVGTRTLFLSNRQAAKLMHPDRATTDTKRERRNVMMAKVNRAYDSGNLSEIEKLIVEFGQDPEAIKGEDVGARLIKAIRRIAQLHRRLSEAEKELAELQQHELYELMATVQETQAMGDDTLGDLTMHLMQQISEHKIQLEMLRYAMDTN